jgi:hypothetical protein
VYKGGVEIFQPVKNQSLNYPQVRSPKLDYTNQFKFDYKLCIYLEQNLEEM